MDLGQAGPDHGARARSGRVAAFALLVVTLVGACASNGVSPAPSGPVATDTASPASPGAPTADIANPTPEPSEVARIAVLPCPTEYAAPGQTMPPIGSTMTATVTPAVAADVTYYSNGDLTILGPIGWQCRASVGADTTTRMAITPPDRTWPTGSSTPAPDLPAVTAVGGGSCLTCVARLACALFPEASQLADGACAASVPAQEQVRRPFPRTAVFEDPPGVAGTGEPSGGVDRSLGFVVFGSGDGATGAAQVQPTALKVTCSLPESMTAICDEIVEHR
jgi:hypothetical protein